MRSIAAVTRDGEGNEVGEQKLPDDQPIAVQELAALVDRVEGRTHEESDHKRPPDAAPTERQNEGFRFGDHGLSILRASARILVIKGLNGTSRAICAAKVYAGPFHWRPLNAWSNSV